MEDTDVKPLSPTKDVDEIETKITAKQKTTPSETNSVKISFSEKESGKKTQPLIKSNELQDTDAENEDCEEEEQIDGSQDAQKGQSSQSSKVSRAVIESEKVQS